MSLTFRISLENLQKNFVFSDVIMDYDICIMHELHSTWLLLKQLSPVVQRVDNDIRWISLYRPDSSIIGFLNTCSLVSDSSSG